MQITKIVAAADSAKSSSPSCSVFLVQETWMVVCATCIQVSCTSFSHMRNFSYEKLTLSDINSVKGKKR